MAALTTPAVAATVAALTTKVRRYVGDTSSNTALQRWSDSDIRSSIDDMLAQMYVEVTGNDPSSFLASVNLVYTADAERVALAAGYEHTDIYRIEDITDSDFQTSLSFVNPLDSQKFADSQGWTYEGNAISLIPKPSTARTLRIWYLKPFAPIAASAAPSTDQHSLSINHEELIALGAAVRLQETDDETTTSRLIRYTKLWEGYQMAVSRYRGPTYVRSTRIILR